MGHRLPPLERGNAEFVIATFVGMYECYQQFHPEWILKKGLNLGTDGLSANKQELLYLQKAVLVELSNYFGRGSVSMNLLVAPFDLAEANKRG